MCPGGYLREGMWEQALHFLFSCFPLISCPLSVFQTCSPTAKIASASNLRKTAFSLMNYVWPWMSAKLCECPFFYALVTFCVFNVWMKIWSTVRSSVLPFALSGLRRLRCLKFTLLYVEMQLKYSDNQGLSIVPYYTIIPFFLMNGCVVVADYNSFAWLLSFVFFICCSCLCQWRVGWVWNQFDN